VHPSSRFLIVTVTGSQSETKGALGRVLDFAEYPLLSPFYRAGN
jgi:hypothetical protein